MTIGLLFLGAVALLIFFGVANTTLKEIGIAEWVAFVFVLALVIGVVVPSVQIGNVYLSVSGLIIPLLSCAMLIVAIGIKKELFFALFASIAIASITVLVKMFFPISVNAFVAVQSIIIGFVAGILACIIAKKQAPALLSALLGILIGDTIIALINFYAYHHLYVGIGSDGIFDALIIASVIGVTLVGIAESMRVAKVRRKYSPPTQAATVGASNMEVGSDVWLQERYKQKLKRRREVEIATDVLLDEKREKKARKKLARAQAKYNKQNKNRTIVDGYNETPTNFEAAQDAWIPNQNESDNEYSDYNDYYSYHDDFDNKW